jgi:Arc/MetJ-type ribon-helix-helix transcriptional regulator
MVSRDRRPKELKYTTIHIPAGLACLIDDLLENEDFAYASRSEFVKDAIRRFLEYHGHYPKPNISLEKNKVTRDSKLLDEDPDKAIADLNARIKVFQELKNVLVRENHKE